MYRNNIKFIIILFAAVLGLQSCYEETKVLVNAEFQAIIENNNHTAPVSVTFQNNTTGADFYQWTFDNGTPSSSNEQHPGTVVYNKAGTYTIKLEAWNNNERDTKEFTFSVDSTVNVAFNTEILVNDFAPAEIKFTNLTTGASTYEWIFEGGNPGTSSEQYPATVKFGTPGVHKITLIVSNGRESFTTSRTVDLLPVLNVSFDVLPSFNDYDYEVPFTASLINKTTSGLTYEWTAIGGTLTDRNAENSEVTFTNPGTYTITLKGDNAKEAKTFSREITLKRNTNIFSINDVRFSIKKAEATLGCFYSLAQRKILTKGEITSTTGEDINLVFFGLDAGFSRCYFLSPDDVLTSGFSVIPQATKTYVANDISLLNFTDSDFQSMTDDTKLKTLDIKAASNTTVFTNVFIPRLILFETAQGIKGAIRIKAFVSEGDKSYVLADIKVQKEKAQ